jgi:hypothetical protein
MVMVMVMAMVMAMVINTGMVIHSIMEKKHEK